VLRVTPKGLFRDERSIPSSSAGKAKSAVFALLHSSTICALEECAVPSAPLSQAVQKEFLSSLLG
jgi:hypothetical protein